MSSSAPARHSAVTRELARDRVGVPAVWAFLMSGIAPLTVAAGVIPAAYAATGLAGIPFAFAAVAAVLALFVPGYVALSRHVVNAGAFYGFIAKGLGRPAGVAAAAVALLAYNLLQVGLYGAFGPAAAAEAQQHLHVSWPWWAWALAAWLLVAVLGRLGVDVAAKVLGVLTLAELAVTAVLVAEGLGHPAGGHLSWSPLSPASLGAGGWGTFGVLAVVAGLGYVGFEQAPVYGEEARDPRRTIPRATYLALAGIAVVYAGAAWAVSVHAGPSRVVAAAASLGPELMFGMGGGALAQAARALFLTSLFAALLAFHNAVWRYAYAASREGVLPEFLSRTGARNVPGAASLAQSLAGLAVIAAYAAGGWPPMTDLFYWLGTTGGLGILTLLAATSAAAVRFFRRHDAGEPAWARAVAPSLSAVSLAVIVVLAVTHYAALLGTAPGSPAAWALPAGFAVAAAAGLGWAAFLRLRRPDVYAVIGLGAGAARAGAAPGARS